MCVCVCVYYKTDFFIPPLSLSSLSRGIGSPVACYRIWHDVAQVVTEKNGQQNCQKTKTQQTLVLGG